MYIALKVDCAIKEYSLAHLVTESEEDEREGGEGVSDADDGGPPLRAVAHERQEAHGLNHNAKREADMGSSTSLSVLLQTDNLAKRYVLGPKLLLVMGCVKLGN